MQEPTGQTLRTSTSAYRVHELVAAGGFGSVYYGRDLSTNTPVAVKLLHPHHTHDARVIRQFEQEAELVRGVRHPNVVQILDQGRDDNGAPFIVQEWVTGWTIGALLQRNGAFSVGEAIADICQALDGLEVSWQRGIIHRDIKPLNLMVTADGVVKIMDFGIAKDQTLAAISGSTVLTGTPAYMAPEQFRGDPIDGRVDLYALGITLYEMLTGRTPFEADSWSGYMFQHLQNPPPPLATVVPNLNPAIAGIVQRAMAKDPGERFQSPTEMRAALIAYAGRATQPAPVPPRATEPTPTPEPRGTLPMPGPADALANRPVAPAPAPMTPHAPAPAGVMAPPASPTPPTPVYEVAGNGGSPPAGKIPSGGRATPGANPGRTLFWVGLGVLATLLLGGGLIFQMLLSDTGFGARVAATPTREAIVVPSTPAPTAPGIAGATPTTGSSLTGSVGTALPISTRLSGGTTIPSTPVPRGPIALSQPIRSELRFNGERHAYTFAGQADQDVQIDLAAPSSPVDPYLQLIGPDGRVLVEDDDTAGLLDARIHWRLPSTGAYTIIVRDFSDDDIGTYTLTVAPGRFARVGEWTFQLRVTTNTCGPQPAVGQTIPYRIRLVSKERNPYVADQTTIEVSAEDGAFREDVTFTWPRFSVTLGDERRDHVHLDVTFSNAERATMNAIQHRVSATVDCYVELG